MKSKMNKKGAEMTIGTLVAIILGLIVLVVIALGFTMGWQNLWDSLNVFSPGSSLATVSQGCQVSCTSGDATSFCIQRRSLKKLDETNANILYYKGYKDVEVDIDRGTAKGVSCAHLADAKLISLGTCDNPPTCANNILDKYPACSGDIGTLKEKCLESETENKDVMPVRNQVCCKA